MDRYRFGPFGFSSKKAVYAHARDVRGRYGPRQPIVGPDDCAFVADLYRSNVEVAEKGRDVAWFFWARSPEHPTNCFWIRRPDGTETEFGMRACLDGVERLNRQSLRAAVKEEIDAFRVSRLAPGTTTFVSEFSGKVFPVSEAEVDHVRPFDQIIDQFFGDLPDRSGRGGAHRCRGRPQRAGVARRGADSQLSSFIGAFLSGWFMAAKTAATFGGASRTRPRTERLTR